MDLVRDAGVDVSDWSDFAGGPANAAANPRHYEWSFIETGKVVVLNIWHDALEQRGSQIFLDDNLRDDATFYAKSTTKRVWERRARKFDIAVRLAATEALPIRTIICDGRAPSAMR